MTARPLVASISSLAMLALPSAASAQGVGGSMAAMAAGPAEQVRRTLAELSITTCAPLLTNAATFLFERGQGDFAIQPLSRDVDHAPVILTIQSSHPGEGGARLAIVTVAPTPRGCAGSYQQTVTWPMACARVKTTIFAGFAARKGVLPTIEQSELSAGVQLYLMPTAGGCVSVTKELLG